MMQAMARSHTASQTASQSVSQTTSEMVARMAAVETLLALRPEALAGWHVHHVRFYLTTRDIGVNWGFNGGRIPTALTQIAAAFFGNADALTQPLWHAALWDMVCEHIIPILPITPIGTATASGNRGFTSRTRPEVVFVETTGNPIRWASQERADEWLQNQHATVHRRIDLPWTVAFAHVHAHLTPYGQRDGEVRKARS